MLAPFDPFLAALEAGKRNVDVVQVKTVALDYSERLLLALVVFGVCLGLAYLFSHLLNRLGEQRNLKVNRAFRLVATSQKVVLVIIGIISALGTIGVDVTAIVAGLGLTGFALGLALKDVVSNLLSGIMLIIYRPFDIGDYVDILGSKGEVVDMDLRYIYIRLLEGETTSMIPNSLFLTNMINRVDPPKAAKPGPSGDNI